MSDTVKWVILGAAAVAVISGVIMAVPVLAYMDVNVFNGAISTLVTYAGDGFRFGRGLLNNFLSPWARDALSGLMIWIIGKFFFTWGLKIATWAYQGIFK